MAFEKRNLNNQKQKSWVVYLNYIDSFYLIITVDVQVLGWSYAYYIIIIDHTYVYD